MMPESRKQMQPVLQDILLLDPALSCHSAAMYLGLHVDVVVHHACIERVCKMVPVVEDTARLLLRGQQNRHTAATNMNRESSRSHSVFTCVVESKTTDEAGLITMLSARVNLVDLAGQSYIVTLSHCPSLMCHRESRVRCTFEPCTSNECSSAVAN